MTSDVRPESSPAIGPSAGSKKRYFVDLRVGCVAVRDSQKTDPMYHGLHSDTEGVVWYRHGRDGIGGWTVDDLDIAAAYLECGRLNLSEMRAALKFAADKLEEYDGPSEFAVRLAREVGA